MGLYGAHVLADLVENFGTSASTLASESARDRIIGEIPTLLGGAVFAPTVSEISQLKGGALAASLSWGEAIDTHDEGDAAPSARECPAPARTTGPAPLSPALPWRRQRKFRRESVRWIREPEDEFQLRPLAANFCR